MSKFASLKDLKKIVTLLPDLEVAKPIANINDIEQFKDNSKYLRVWLQQYLKYYNLPSYSNPEILLTIGKLRVTEFFMVVQIYTKKDVDYQDYKGIMIFIHGYLDHFGLYREYINCLLDNGYIVIGMDLPGHGLSTGEIGDIIDFSQYAQGIEILIKTVKQKIPAQELPYYISAFSAGTSIAIEYLLRNSDQQIFKKALLYAPLLRVPLWGYNRLACHIASFVKYISREPKKVSHDPVFLNFVKHNDPLQPKFLPLRWVKAMHDWADRLPKHKPLQLPVLIIQGTEDKTVNWQYNIPRLAGVFPNHEAVYIYGAYHNLCNESKVYRDRIFENIINYLESP